MKSGKTKIPSIHLAELDSELRWDELFSRPESEAFLERMAIKALKAHKAGRTEPLNPEDLTVVYCIL